MQFLCIKRAAGRSSHAWKEAGAKAGGIDGGLVPLPDAAAPEELGSGENPAIIRPWISRASRESSCRGPRTT